MKGSNLVVSLGVACAFVLFSTLGPLSGQDKDVGTGESWGGNHVSVQMRPRGATLEFDCAHGSIAQPIKPNAEGEFTASGTYTPERGGPVFRSNPPRDLPAVYKGTIQGDKMTLEIVLANKDQAPPPLSLTRGANGHLTKCR